MRSPDVRMMKILMHLSEMFPLMPVMKNAGNSWRPSKAESQDAFFLVIERTEDLQTILQHRSEKLLQFGLNIQPLLVVIGTAENFLQGFIILDTVTYEVNNPLTAIDLAFKIFHALHIPYPPECEQIWTFLQHAVYKIHTDRDKKLPGCSRLVSRYNNFSEVPTITI